MTRSSSAPSQATNTQLSLKVATLEQGYKTGLSHLQKGLLAITEKRKEEAAALADSLARIRTLESDAVAAEARHSEHSASQLKLIAELGNERTRLAAEKQAEAEDWERKVREKERMVGELRAEVEQLQAGEQRMELGIKKTLGEMVEKEKIEKERLQRELKESQKTEGKLRRSAAEANSNAKQAHEKAVTALESEVQKLKREVDVEAQEVSRGRKELDRVKQEAKEASRVRDEAKREVSGMQRTIAQLEADKKKIEADREFIQRRWATTDLGKCKLEDQMQAVVSEKSRAETRRDAAERKADELERDGDRLRVDIKKLETLHNEQDERTKKLVEEYAAVNKKLQEKDEALIKYKAKTTELETKLGNYIISKRNVDGLLWQARGELESHVAYRNSMLERTNSQQQAIDRLTRELTDARGKQHSSVRDAEQRVKDAEERVKAAEERVVETEERVKDLDRRIKGSDLRSKDAEQRLQRLEAEHTTRLDIELNRIKRLEGDLETSNKEIDKVRKAMDVAKEFGVALKGEVEGLRDQREVWEEEKEELDRKVERLEQEKGALAKDMKELEEEKLKLEENMKELEDEKESWEVEKTMVEQRSSGTVRPFLFDLYDPLGRIYAA